MKKIIIISFIILLHSLCYADWNIAEYYLNPEVKEIKPASFTEVSYTKNMFDVGLGYFFSEIKSAEGIKTEDSYIIEGCYIIPQHTVVSTDIEPTGLDLFRLRGGISVPIKKSGLRFGLGLCDFIYRARHIDMDWNNSLGAYTGIDWNVWKNFSLSLQYQGGDLYIPDSYLEKESNINGWLFGGEWRF